MARGTTFAPPTERDIVELVDNIRAGDRLELVRWTGQTVDYCVRRSVEISDFCRAARFGDGSLACIFGACRVNLVNPTACLWSLSAKAVDRHPVEFAHGTKVAVDMVFKAMPDVEEFGNWVDLDYRGAVKWIEWFGGTFSVGAKRAGVRGGLFGEFFIENPYYREV